ncbi:MAG: glutathione S-transferase family protein [Rhizobiales bacterium]|nr:glutathione S-transferase family protein [Hyphomicrobiales bacterium]
MIKVWGRRSSSNVQSVLWCLAELELAVERVDAGYIYGVNNTPDYLTINPNGTIPTLIDGDNAPLWESGAILRYLANRYAPPAFWPHDLVARAHVDMWAEWAKLNVASKFTATIFRPVVRTAPSKRDARAIESAIGDLDKVLDIGERQLTERPYLAGQDFTLADIQFGHCLFRYFDIDIKRPERPNLKRYYETLKKRPAFAAHVMVCYDELRIHD